MATQDRFFYDDDPDDYRDAPYYFPGCCSTIRGLARGSIVVCDDRNGNMGIGLFVGFNESHRSSVWICWAVPVDINDDRDDKYVIRGEEFDAMCFAFDSVYRNGEFKGRQRRIEHITQALTDACEYLGNGTPICQGSELHDDIVVARDAILGMQ